MAIVQEARWIKERLSDCEGGFCEVVWPEDPSCLGRIIYHQMSPDDACSTCKELWPHVSAKYEAKQALGKVKRRICQKGKNLLSAGAQ